MPRHRGLKREAQIRKSHGEGLNLHQIAEVVNVSAPTVRSALRLGTQPKQPLGDRTNLLDGRVKTLEEQLAVAKDSMQVTAKMLGFLGSASRNHSRPSTAAGLCLWDFHVTHPATALRTARQSGSCRVGRSEV